MTHALRYGDNELFLWFSSFFLHLNHTQTKSGENINDKFTKLHLKLTAKQLQDQQLSSKFTAESFFYVWGRRWISGEKHADRVPVLSLCICRPPTSDPSSTGTKNKKCLEGIFTLSERRSVQLREGDDDTMLHHTAPQREEEKKEEEGMQQNGATANGRWGCVQRYIQKKKRSRDSGRQRRRNEGGKGGGKDKLKEQGERFSFPPPSTLRLSLAVLIHSFSGL